jgi:hypothetical protein
MVAQTARHDQFVGYDGQIYRNDALNDFGTRECVDFRESILSKYYELAPAMRAEYMLLAQKQSYVAANQRLIELDNYLHVRDFNVLSSHDEIKQFSKKQAERCQRIKASFSDLLKAFRVCEELARSFEISAPDPEDYGDEIEPCINRLCCEKWWKRQLIRKQKEVVEFIARELRQVHGLSQQYCSNISLKRHRHQKASNREYLESQLAVNELDQEYSLAELSDLTVSNPSIRRMELITRCKGFELVAKEFNHEAIFFTLTTPSRFHRMMKITKKGKVVKVIPNKNYESLSPRDAQDYLSSLWGRIQAKLSREKIKPYGFRVAEPHHDATPHWHFLLFIDSQHTEQLISIFRRWALKDSPKEKGALEHRLKVEKIKTGINPVIGKEYSATGYLIKYICKNIDGYGIDNQEESASGSDWDGRNPRDMAERIEAWARTHRIRQFQQIGGPSVTVWRELRRLSEQNGCLEQLRVAADSGDWAAFVKLMGGPNIPRNSQPVRPAYAFSEKLNRPTGEITKVTHTEYGDDARERVIGVMMAGIAVLSRTHFWEIRENEKVHTARQNIMNGIIDLLEEVRDQNLMIPIQPSSVFLQQAQPAALDLCQ